MGTHPIFESDFDCLTEKKMRFLKGFSRNLLIRSCQNQIGSFPVVQSRFTSTFGPVRVSYRQNSGEIDSKKLIMNLRKETQLPLKNCREALQQTEWDYEAAKVYLKKEAKKLGLQKMAKLGKIITNHTRTKFENCLKLKSKYFKHPVRQVKASLVPQLAMVKSL